MTERSTDRDSYFPAIEKKHGQPMAYWFDQMTEITDLKYAEQIAYLRENHGFSQVHANALVLYTRGSKSPQRVASIDEFLEPFDETKRATVRKIFAAITDKFSDMEQVIAWNQPMLKKDGQYILGVSVHTNHILIAPISTAVLEQFRPRLADYQVNKRTFKVPVDWAVDAPLLQDMATARLSEFQ
ncbi:MAG: DUF4287 domain-containing protein [Actinobacteria bacterium]|uniref:Unannotated protein n=1 Tax=freshwater metagenome TaxID=449393 RepID=A0A6J7GYI4_9ZZZZ|nr:DUF4287 domain-containing protein [Actinomycetota bacterium]